MAGSSLLRIRRRTATSGTVIVTIAGEIDLATAGAFRDSLSPHVSDPATTLLVCDLAQVRFMACCGLTVLLDTQNALRARGARLSVVADHPAVLRPVRVTGLRDVLQVRPTVPTAHLQSIVD